MSFNWFWFESVCSVVAAWMGRTNPRSDKVRKWAGIEAGHRTGCGNLPSDCVLSPHARTRATIVSDLHAAAESCQVWERGIDQRAAFEISLPAADATIPATTLVARLNAGSPQAGCHLSEKWCVVPRALIRDLSSGPPKILWDHQPRVVDTCYRIGADSSHTVYSPGIRLRWASPFRLTTFHCTLPVRTPVRATGLVRGKSLSSCWPAGW